MFIKKIPEVVADSADFPVGSVSSDLVWPHSVTEADVINFLLSFK
jgi:hypothetical protein